MQRVSSIDDKTHWLAIKLVLRYVREIIDVGLICGISSNNDNVIEGFVDAYYSSNLDKRRSQTWMLGNVVIWKATLQHLVAFTIESEYIVLIEAIKEVL